MNYNNVIQLRCFWKYYPGTYLNIIGRVTTYRLLLD